MRLYNTLGGRKEDLQTLEPHRVKMYVCGPTTYNFIHLGNARPLAVFDTVRRYLAYRGYEVMYVQNFTDVDDKIINRANEEGANALELAQRYIDAYFTDADALNIKRADAHPQVSQHMNEIVASVQGLIEKGYAYEIDGDVYYRVAAFKDYGKLSGRSLEDMLAGARVGIDERKENAMDFALWKKAKAGEPSWPSPWGAGRPGWHIECSVMSTKYLGDSFDIHGGGSDLIFPHHENEIAQAEALTGQPFVRYWMHNGFITVNNEKMSKSLGNFFVLRDILAQYPADVVRFYLISTHYRSPLDFDDGKLEEARKALGRLKTTLLLAAEFMENGAAAGLLGPREEEFIKSLEAQQGYFIEAMDDDFNTARALGHLFEMSHSINSYVAGADKNNPAHQAAVRQAHQLLFELGDVLGIFITPQNQGGAVVEEVLQVLAGLRSQARAEKDYQLADQIRDFFAQIEVRVEDTPDGSRFRFEQPPRLKTLVEQLIALRAAFKQNKAFDKADLIRNRLQEAGVVLEDTREGVRWKLADA
ncbi:MAG TPA: cysteine--tRNA ligase [Syntrophomonas sp.]|jgi:cysteinyl-tRNA synthetase|nr:cysteine--tRNA ligase [Syntrophomonas sp.]